MKTQTLRTHMRVLLGWLLIAAGGCGALAQAADDPLSNYHGNSLVCLDSVTKATCYIWFGSVWKDGDQSYMVMWDRGVQTELPTVGGNFRIEGRDGTYKLKGGQLCLSPKSNPKKSYAMEKQGELYAGSGCYEVAPHAVGDKWTQKDAQGREVTFWLLKGR